MGNFDLPHRAEEFREGRASVGFAIRKSKGNAASGSSFFSRFAASSVRHVSAWAGLRGFSVRELTR
jgi:hypothetical protein